MQKEIFFYFFSAAFLAAAAPGPKKYDCFHGVETINRHCPQCG
jgi:hypothetical protein